MASTELNATLLAWPPGHEVVENVTSELDVLRAILEARHRTNLGPARLAGLVGYRRSTIWKVLARHGCSRRRRSPKQQRPTRRYEWSQPGALLHMDSKQLPVFSEPGHWVDGDRSLRQRRRPKGSRRIEFAHCVVDDRTRLAYVEIHPSTAATPPPPFSTAHSPGLASKAARRPRPW